ncbi:hypothetical protein ACJ41O_001802 [Fusarium nematophilum]
MATSPVLLILGGGPRIGHSVAKRFLQEGYKVAIGRRTESTTPKGAVHVSADVTRLESVEAAFREVESKLGIPNVVVYNAAAVTFPEKDDPFSVPPESFDQDMVVNASGAYAALYHTTRGFQKLKEQPSGLPTVFIATGNVTPFQPNPLATTLGSGKAALAHLLAIGEKAYSGAGYRFYFASQIQEDGGPVPYPDVKGEAHGDVYWKAVQGEMGVDGWDLRFTVDADGVATERKA